MFAIKVYKHFIPQVISERIMLMYIFINNICASFHSLHELLQHWLLLIFNL